MGNNNCQSILRICDLYYSKFRFEQNRNLKSESKQIATNIEAEYARNDIDPNKYRVIIRTVSKDDGNRILLELETIGIFEIVNEEKCEEIQIEEIILKNTISIMLPFIRSQIALLTTQPGVAPILLQPIDVNKLTPVQK